MNRTEELRQQVIGQLQTDIADFEKYGGDEFGSDSVVMDIITARRTVELLKKLEVPVEAKWHYYINDENKARWKCSECGKICRRDPADKLYCSHCGSRNQKEC